MNSNKNQKQVSLAGAAMGGSGNSHRGGKPRKPGKARFPRRWILLIAALVALVGVVAGILLYSRRDKGQTLSAREFVDYAYTPDAQLDDVSYYALGISGDNAANQLDMAAILCVNRQDKAASLLQLPVSTYIADTARFAVQTVGNVWASPKALTWCPTCRRRITAEETTDGKHTACGTKAESRSGSSASNYAEFFNTQLGLPVDNYLVIPRSGLAALVDAVGGVTLNVSKKLSYNGINYDAGARTLPGDASVYYITQWEYNGTPASDLARMQRQRELLAALAARLSGYKVHELYNTDPKKTDVLSNVMAGRYPIRMDTSDFGKARLLGKTNDNAAQDVRYTQALAEWVYMLCRIPQEKVTCSMLPGEAVKKGSATVYSAHKAQTVELLKAHMDPAGLLAEETIELAELANKTKAETNTVTLDTLLTAQTDVLQKTEE